MSNNRNALSFYTRLETLKKKHENLSQQITQEQNNLSAGDYYLKQLKRQKLFLKDQIYEMVGDLRGKSVNSY